MNKVLLVLMHLAFLAGCECPKNPMDPSQAQNTSTTTPVATPTPGGATTVVYNNDYETSSTDDWAKLNPAALNYSTATYTNTGPLQAGHTETHSVQFTQNAVNGQFYLTLPSLNNSVDKVIEFTWNFNIGSGASSVNFSTGGNRVAGVTYTNSSAQLTSSDGTLILASSPYPSAWHSIKMVVHHGSTTVDYYLDSTLVGSGAYTASAAPSGITGLWVENNPGTGSWSDRVDDIKVTN
jgi:hypothetical protein